MHDINKIMKNTVLFFLTAMLTSGCMLEKDGPSAQMQGVMIQVEVSAEGMTKADYEDPTDIEKVINSLRIYAFQGDRLAGYTQRQATSLNDPFFMDLELPQSGVHNVDFYIIANEVEMAYENGQVQINENMTRSQLEALKFTGLSSRTALPMYCQHLNEPIDVDKVKEAAGTEEGHQGHFILDKSVTFVLERSLAKLSVYAAKAEGASSNPHILGVDLLAQGTRQYSYLFPQDVAVLDAVPSRANNRVLSSSDVEITKVVAKGSSEASNTANYTEVVSPVYMPEVREGVEYDSPSYRWNSFAGDPADAARAAVLHVEYSVGGELRNAYVYLPKVQRNHHIKVCILINAEGQIIINYVVADWDWDEDKMQDWFFDYPTHSYVWHKLPQSEDDLLSKPENPATMSETRPFIGYFQMTYPTSDTWTPTLEGLNASRCELKVYDHQDNPVFSLDSPSPLPVSEDWYRIEVSPKPGYMDAGDVVNLAITYTPGGLTESEYLLINGAHNDYFWKGSTDANYITITMVN